MNVLLTGATGYIGRAVAEALTASGHRVTGLARSDEAARTLETRGYAIARGDVRRRRAGCMAWWSAPPWSTGAAAEPRYRSSTPHASTAQPA